MVAQEARTVTLFDVATEAGVSLATASRALNGSARRVREDLRLRVLEAAAALNYSPNAAAQVVARGRSNLVGLLVHEIADPYFSAIASGVMGAAEKSGLLVTVASTGRDADREAVHIAAFRGQRARAVILAGSRLDDTVSLERLGQELVAFEGTGGRVVMISQSKLPVDTVVVENHAGARNLAETLVGLGYRRFAVLAGPPGLLTARDRLAGFRAGLAGADIHGDSVDVVRGGFDREGGYSAMNQLLDRGTEARCLFAVNDVMAMGAIAAMRERGLEVPRDMAMAGFGDFSMLRDITPTLTTVTLPLEDIGASALDLVFLERADKPRSRRIRGEVVVRASTPQR
ncbi:LacI family transcriptional regulator [Planosporangium flavigriseum]|uniref:LacI family transcriptional regulator n=1 Tax=Planosporangium flavigriseum TaxID=373681 RepID=A0A8J3PR44_9ACTN|nr:LacI family DNA-binding transcriptional regulator [Planosporangium flavigriseum]NJC63137.1 LacI family transcriptional regulator [Planosporangium flavigriseum]GIG76751.1 LacI family transcriptional regulator [Planosporangium flavigriseum]